MNGTWGRSWQSTPGTTTDDDPTAAANSAPPADLSQQRIKRRATLGGLIYYQ